MIIVFSWSKNLICINTHTYTDTHTHALTTQYSVINSLPSDLPNLIIMHHHRPYPWTVSHNQPFLNCFCWVCCHSNKKSNWYNYPPKTSMSKSQWLSWNFSCTWLVNTHSTIKTLSAVGFTDGCLFLFDGCLGHLCSHPFFFHLLSSTLQRNGSEFCSWDVSALSFLAVVLNPESILGLYGKCPKDAGLLDTLYSQWIMANPHLDFISCSLHPTMSQPLCTLFLYGPLKISHTIHSSSPSYNSV